MPGSGPGASPGAPSSTPGRARGMVSGLFRNCFGVGSGTVPGLGLALGQPGSGPALIYAGVLGIGFRNYPGIRVGVSMRKTVYLWI